jgi:hypothetical protein
MSNGKNPYSKFKFNIPCFLFKQSIYSGLKHSGNTDVDI